MLLAFAPFVAFAVLDRIAGPLTGLLAGAATALALVLRDHLAARSLKLLEIGTALLFALLAGWTIMEQTQWSVVAVRFWVDAGLLGIVLLSLALGEPFTLQYAREQVAPAQAATPEFRRANMVITAVWAGAFAILVAVEAALVWLPGTPPGLAITAGVLALVGAVRFTSTYPDRLPEDPNPIPRVDAISRRTQS